MRDALADTDPEVAVGAQNVHHELAGAYTGEIAAPMLAGLATWVIVGHSERRRDAGETDALVARKVARALDAGLRPIVCVGEQLEEREAGRANDVVDTQIRGSLAGVSGSMARGGRLVVAYEPVWAIGTGRNATGLDAAAMADVIRGSLDGAGLGCARRRDVPSSTAGASPPRTSPSSWPSRRSTARSSVAPPSSPTRWPASSARAGLTARPAAHA